MVGEVERKMNKYGEYNRNEKMRMREFFAPQLIDSGDDGLLISYTEIDSEYNCSVCFFGLTQNRDIAKVLGAQALL